MHTDFIVSNLQAGHMFKIQGFPQSQAYILGRRIDIIQGNKFQC